MTRWLVAGLCALLPVSLLANDSQSRLLRDLTAIEVVVLGITPEMANEGLRDSDILVDIERRLRTSRVQVRPGGGQVVPGIEPRDPLLTVTVDCRQVGRARFCNVDLELREMLSPTRDLGLRFLGASWRLNWRGEVSRIGNLRSQVESMIDQFAQDLATGF